MSALKSVRYRCASCGGVSRFQFARDYKPYLRWCLTCLCCGRYGLHTSIERKALTRAER